MKIDTGDLISVTDASSKGVSKLVSDAENGRPQVLIRNNKAVAAIVNITDLDRLQRVEELENDVRLLSIALARAAADSGRRYDHDEVAHELASIPASSQSTDRAKTPARICATWTARCRYRYSRPSRNSRRTPSSEANRWEAARAATSPHSASSS